MAAAILGGVPLDAGGTRRQTGSVPSYAGGIALWSASLVMTSVAPTFAVWTRLTGAFAALVFAITAVQISWNIPLLPTSAPLPSIGYPFLVVTFAGWIWRLLSPPT